MTTSAYSRRYGYWRGAYSSDGPVPEPELGFLAAIVGTALGSPSLSQAEGEGDQEVRTYAFKLRVPTGRGGESIVLTFFDPHCPAHERWPRYLEEMRRDSLVRVEVHAADLPRLINEKGELCRPLREDTLAIAVEVFDALEDER